MKNNLSSGKTLAKLLSVLIVIAVLLTVVPVAYAESNGPLTAIPGLGRLPNETLMKMHQKVGGWLVDQEAVFVQAGLIGATYDDLITAQSKKKKDVTFLKDALSSFLTEVAGARDVNSQAGITIFSLSGWKANGEVRDRLAAGESLLLGRDQVKDANFRLTNAINILRKSLDRWRVLRLRGEQ
jgi:hypothetical protein